MHSLLRTTPGLARRGTMKLGLGVTAAVATAAVAMSAAAWAAAAVIRSFLAAAAPAQPATRLVRHLPGTSLPSPKRGHEQLGEDVERQATGGGRRAAAAKATGGGGGDRVVLGSGRAGRPLHVRPGNHAVETFRRCETRRLNRAAAA